MITDQELSTSQKTNNILHVTTVGVTARLFLLPILKRLQAEGFNVYLACCDDQDAQAVAAAGIPVYPVYISRKISPYDFISIWKLFWFMRKHKFEIVNTHTAKAGFLGRMAAWLARVPSIIHTAHGMTIHPYQSKPIKILYTFLERWIGKRTTVFIAVTDKIKDDLIGLGIASKNNCLRIYNGLNLNIFSATKIKTTNRFKMSEKTFVIGTVSRLVSDKGLDDLIRAMALIDNPNVILVVAGDGELRSSLSQLSHHLNISHRIKFIGWQENIAQLMPNFDIFCLPTLREGFGYVFLEAQAMAVPVIASNINPLIETMAETAIFSPVKEPKLLAKNIKYLIENPQQRKKLGQLGAERVAKRFDQNEQINQIITVYKDLLGID